MFTFFHRKPVITVDCFTANEFVYEHTPIRPTSKHLPMWWKKLPTQKLSDRRGGITNPKSFATMKNCAGFVELFKAGAIIEHWSELTLNVSNEGIHWNASTSNMMNHESHFAGQYGHAYKNYNHLKLNSPWVFREKTGVKFVFTEASWLLENHPFTVLPGIIDYRLNHSTAINLFFPKGDYQYFIEAGQPLVQVIPLVEDKNVEFKNHLVSQPQFHNILTSGSLALFGGYRALKKLVSRNDKQNGTLCPYREE